ncbi:fibulin-7 [Pelobates cultripes]|uniref:Fibulin-7 n=1 Tax=Pelobates cultripes TaxID=61616 RepID=A0AAD1RGA6_PELCU|nr:fibulin-7 [Pelobates cultripes]CAH2253125.1 fibulin-7 [Pelobates cultripes]
MTSGLQYSVLVFLCFTAFQESQAAQSCLNKQQLLAAIRQMQQFLKGQETRFAEGIRIMKSRLNTLQSTLSKASPDPQLVSCPVLEAPDNGNKFGSKYLMDHEVHYTCDSGYQLVGPSSRLCQQNGSWTGDVPHCKDINPCSSNPCLNGGTCVEGGSRQYKCTCPQEWTGSNCQYQTQTAVNPTHHNNDKVLYSQTLENNNKSTTSIGDELYSLHNELSKKWHRLQGTLKKFKSNKAFGLQITISTLWMR